MQIFKGIESMTNFGDCVVTVGSFDGVHSGHSVLLETLRLRAEDRGCKSVVVTFSPHPRVTLGRAEGLTLLTSECEKANLLSEKGIDALLIIEFNHEVSSLSYEEFLSEYLVKKAGMVELIVGFNHRLGHNGGDYNDLVQFLSKDNIDITQAQEHAPHGEKVSSTTIRTLISCGEIERANTLLSHPYLMIGTAANNGEVCFEERLKLIPPAGCYAVQIDGVDSRVVVDSELRVWCDQNNRDVEIKIIGRYED